ncbi:MAG: hypothetical protein JW751_31390 [Polyangiaceae bacterium]|nr:hypothetical protein [Polyangiaceae bacterium]
MQFLRVGVTRPWQLRRTASRALGWASNDVKLHAAIQQFAGHPAAKRGDEYWGRSIPIPALGAAVAATGRYGMAFARASWVAVADPIVGSLTHPALIFCHEPPPLLAHRPGWP